MDYKKILIVDLNSGSYVKNDEGHERFNLDKNSLDGKNYGYCPPIGRVNIEKFTKDKLANSFEGILVVYVQAMQNSKNREIIALCPNAKVFKDKQINNNINRSFIDKNGDIKIAGYSIVSDTILMADSYEEKFVIEREKYSLNMFRAQRVYGEKYPELSKDILN